ncbi:hypothetical protein JGU66_26990 [Myxococcaceae bacterium JPH2]|nr:hypothetical protein [Myxococcaceae bacterium JPH2]
MTHPVRVLPLLSALVPALLLTACDPMIEVRPATVSEKLPAPTFALGGKAGTNRKLGYTRLMVTTQDGQQVWTIHASQSGNVESPPVIVFGQAPAGFETDQKARPLEPGKHYNLHVTGNGIGGLDFRVGNDGTIIVDAGTK